MTILCKEHGALIVLENDIVTNDNALGLKEIVSPANQMHGIIHSDNLCFHQALHAQTLFGRERIHTPSTQTHSGTCVALHVQVYHKQSINPPADSRRPVT